MKPLQERNAASSCGSQISLRNLLPSASYTDLAALIQMAKARGWPTVRIVREISFGLGYADTLALARRVAPLLDLSVSEFMRLRKNE